VSYFNAGNAAVSDRIAVRVHGKRTELPMYLILQESIHAKIWCGQIMWPEGARLWPPSRPVRLSERASVVPLPWSHVNFRFILPWYSEHFSLLGYNAFWSVDSEPMFRRNMSAGWKRNMPRKKSERQLTCNGLHGDISQKIELFITTAERTSGRYGPLFLWIASSEL
jgi:hypothetical protein